ncbi:MAG: hypothetical protein AAGA30_06550 [Planctomycetota bacterium]
MLKFSIRDLLWITLLVSVAIFAYLKTAELRKTKAQLESTKAQVQSLSDRNEKLSDLVGEALRKAGKMYAEGRESMKIEMEQEAK